MKTTTTKQAATLALQVVVLSGAMQPKTVESIVMATKTLMQRCGNVSE
jgi:hypothetical protein